VQAWVPHLAFAANPPGWSLSVEAFFYAVFPFVVHRLRCRTVRQLVALTVPLWVLAMAPATVLELVEHNGGLRGTSTTSILGVALTPALVAERLAAQLPLARLAEFCIGICVGHYVVARTDAAAGAGAAPAAARTRRLVGVAGGIAAVALVVALIAAGDLHESSEIVVNSAFVAPIVAVLLLALCLGGGPLVRSLSSRRVVQLGTASYALYIVQDPFAWWWQKLPVPDLASGAGLALFLVAIIATSLVCERWIEVPARRRLLAWRDRKIARRTPAARATA
jgi:peptidoglycan/LPS O-acetylase OafA/YrhL